MRNTVHGSEISGIKISGILNFSKSIRPNAGKSSIRKIQGVPKHMVLTLKVGQGYENRSVF